MHTPPTLEYAVKFLSAWPVRRVIGTLFLAVSAGVAFLLCSEALYRLKLFYVDYGGVAGMSHIGDGAFPGYYKEGIRGAALAAIAAVFFLWRYRKSTGMAILLIALNLAGGLLLPPHAPLAHPGGIFRMDPHARAVIAQDKEVDAKIAGERLEPLRIVLFVVAFLFDPIGLPLALACLADCRQRGARTKGVPDLVLVLHGQGVLPGLFDVGCGVGSRNARNGEIARRGNAALARGQYQIGREIR